MASDPQSGDELKRLIELLGKLPGLGPRSGRRAALALVKKREALLRPLIASLSAVADTIRPCTECGNLDTRDPCALCTDARRDRGLVCVVEDVGDIWALERAGVFKGLYHVLGGTLSAIDGVGPEDLRIPALLSRLAGVREVILALSATVDGQATVHYLADRLATSGVRLTRLAHGVPVGGELDYLDDGTLTAALEARRSL